MNHELENSIVRKICWRILPLLIIGYFFSYIDRINISFAGITMKEDFALSPRAYGFGAGIFFLGYVLFEVPSNLLMTRTGARVWLARIMVTWGIISAGTAFVWSDVSFACARFLLGFAEAGFFPGIIYYLTQWLPARHRAKIFGFVLATGVVSVIIGSPFSGWILTIGTMAGLKSWQWLLIIEGLPSAVLGIAILFCLPPSPDKVLWLSDAEKKWVSDELRKEKSQLPNEATHVKKALVDSRVWLLGIMVFPLAVAIFGMFTWLPQVVNGLGMSYIRTGIINSVPFAVAAVAMVWWGRHSDKAGERGWHLIIPTIVGAIGIILAAITPVSAWTLVWLSIGMAGVFSTLTLIVSITPEFLTGSAAAAGIALVNSIGNTGSFAGPYVIGWIRGEGGAFQTALLATGLLLLLDFVLAIWFQFRFAKKIRRAQAGLTVFD